MPDEYIASQARSQELKAALKAEEEFRRRLDLNAQLMGDIADEAFLLGRAVTFGYYEPKNVRFDDNGQPILSKAQRRRLKQVVGKFSSMFEAGKRAVPVTHLPKAQRAKILKKAREAGLETSRNAIVIHAPKAEDVRLETNPDTQWQIVVENRFNNGNTETQYLPLASVDELANKRDKLHKQFNRVAGRLKDDEDLRFYVQGKWASFKTFSGKDFDAMWTEFNKYRDDNAGMYDFATQIRLGIVKKKSNPVHKVKTKAEITLDKERRNAAKNKTYKRYTDKPSADMIAINPYYGVDATGRSKIRKPRKAAVKKKPAAKKKVAAKKKTAKKKPTKKG